MTIKIGDIVRLSVVGDQHDNALATVIDFGPGEHWGSYPDMVVMLQRTQKKITCNVDCMKLVSPLELLAMEGE